MGNLRSRNRLTKQLDRFREFLDSDSGYATATHVVLALIAVAGIVVVIGIAPNIFQISRQFGRSKKFKKDELREAYYNLRRSGYLETEEVNGTKRVSGYILIRVWMNCFTPLIFSAWPSI